MYVLANFVKALVPFIEPYMPTLADKILEQLKSPHDQISVLHSLFVFQISHTLIAGKIRVFVEARSHYWRASTTDCRSGCCKSKRMQGKFQW